MADAAVKVKMLDKYLLGEVMGEGSTGKVKYATDTETGERVAVKIIALNKIKKDPRLMSQVEREIVVLERLECNYIVKLKKVLRSKSKYYLVMECVAGGSLIDYILKHGRLDEDRARRYLQHIVAGVEYCHAHHIYHRDLKPDNVLLTEDLLTAKVSDFGLSGIVNDANDYMTTRCGSPFYAAPELFLDKTGKYRGGPVDVWGIGLILFVMLAGYMPFSDEDNAVLIRKITTLNFKWPRADRMGPGPRDLLSKILVIDPKQRYTIQQIKLHPWFAVNDTTTYITEPIDMSSSSLESSEVGIGGVDALTYSESDSGSSSGSDESLDDGAPSLQFGDDSPKKKKEKEKPQKQQQNQLTSQKRLPPPPPSTPASSPVGDDENDDHGDHQDVASRGNMSDSTVPKANAFDLIALSGAFDLSKLFAKKSSADLNFAVNHYTMFIQEGGSIAEVYERLFGVVSGMNVSVKRVSDSDDAGDAHVSKYALKVTAKGTGGIFRFRIELLRMAHELYLVQFTRTQGDPADFYLTYKQIYDACKPYRRSTTVTAALSLSLSPPTKGGGSSTTLLRNSNSNAKSSYTRDDNNISLSSSAPHLRAGPPVSTHSSAKSVTTVNSNPRAEAEVEVDADAVALGRRTVSSDAVTSSTASSPSSISKTKSRRDELDHNRSVSASASGTLDHLSPGNTALGGR